MADLPAVRGQDELDVSLQLAARWAEFHAPEADRTAGLLERFRYAHAFIDAVIHGIEPPSIPEKME
jgi:hypothetical protein